MAPWLIGTALVCILGAFLAVAENDDSEAMQQRLREHRALEMKALEGLERRPRL